MWFHRSPVFLENASHDFVMILSDAASAGRWFVESKPGFCSFKWVPTEAAFHVHDVVNDVLDQISIQHGSGDKLEI